MKLSQLAEHQIRKAEAEGRLKNLKGEGKPLPARGDGDSADQAGYRIMAEAGALPPEIELNKKIETLREKLQATSDPATAAALRISLNDLQMRLAVQQEARRKDQGPL